MPFPLYVKGLDPIFDASLPFIRREEGGNDDDPNDSGGRTSRGIIQREYNAWRDEHNEPRKDVWTASDQEVDSIYYYGTKQDHYWLPKCPTLASGVSLVYFNIAVNGGHGRADQILAESIGGTDAETVERMCDNLEHFYRSLAKFHIYGRDWLSRTARCRALARTLVNKPKEHTAMPPTATQPSPQAMPGFKINFGEIEQGLETVAKFLPIVAGFYPPLSIVLPFVPIAEGILKMIDELKQASAAGGQSGDFAMIVQSHLHGIASNIQALVQQHKLPMPLMVQMANQAAAQAPVGGPQTPIPGPAPFFSPGVGQSSSAQG